ncbi:MAG: hypothetical protein LC722_03480 [Actinobacteria bacterium]|nr:hypothetical protein [Actinomycetota bacterium]
MRSRPILALILAAALGVGGGITLARISDDNPEVPGEVIPLGKTIDLQGEPGTLTLAYPEEWRGGRARVNCATATDVHVSTDNVSLTSFVRAAGTGQTCTPELDVRALSPEGAYVSAAFFEFADVGCGASLPTTAPDSIGAMQLDTPSKGTLREFGAEAAYDPFEWRHSTWCLPGGFAVRVDVLIGHSATGAVRDRVDVVVQALRFTPAAG